MVFRKFCVQHALTKLDKGPYAFMAFIFLISRARLCRYSKFKNRPIIVLA